MSLGILLFVCFQTVQMHPYSSNGKSKGKKRKNAASEPFHSEIVSKNEFHSKC